MLKNKTVDRVCCVLTAVMILVSVLMWGWVESMRGDGSHTIGYENLLFDKTTVHTIDISMDNWDEFIAGASSEEYADCSVTIDGEKFSHVGIRAKGNTSLSSVSTLGSSRYSFKVEFNHYTKGMTYHGLDKLSLNNLIQDAAMMKDYLAYTLMERMGVPASQCSYVWITVNGEPWGLYLAVESVEDSFTDRNGMTKGELYKPDSMSFGGGRGNGQGFDFENFRVNEDGNSADTESADTESAAAESSSGTVPESAGNGQDNGREMPSFGGFTGQPSEMPSGERPEMPSGERPEMPSGNFSFDFGRGGGIFNFGMGSEDVKLVYSDDNPDSYSNIFSNAKTKISSKDKERLIESIRKLNAKEDIESVVNTDEVIRYLAVHNFLCNDDSYTGMMVHNYYLYEENGKLSIIPWDYNLGFGGFSASGDATSTVNSPIDSPVSGGSTESRPLIAWIFSDEEALAEYHAAYDRLISENIESGWLADEISRVQEMIDPWLENDPTSFYTAEEHSQAVETLQAFCARRGESVRGQLDGTIPSTSAGQSADKSALVDASDISVASMGSMNGSRSSGSQGGMPNMGGMPDIGSMPDMGRMPNMGSVPGMGSGGAAPEASAEPESSEAPEAEETAEPASGPEPGGAGNTGGPGLPENGPPGGTFGGMQQPDQSGFWIEAGVCAVLLLAALIAVRRIRGHNQ